MFHQHPVFQNRPVIRIPNSKKIIVWALAAQVMLLASFSFLPALAQTEPAPPSDITGNDPNGANLSPGAQNTDETVPDQNYNEPPTNYVQQAAEQNTDLTVFNVEEMLKTDFVDYNDTYYGLATFWTDDIVGNLFHNIGQLIGKWLTELINGWISDAVQFLTGILRTFVLNPNIAVNGISGTLGGGSGQPSDDISPFIRQGADVMYGIAVDLLLLLFILCIWKYWADAAWRGGGNLMGAVGRLIFTAGLLLAWPTIYAFEIQISNEMIKAIYFNSADQVAMLDAAMAAAVKGGLLAGAGLIMNATAPVGGQVLGGLLGGGAGGLVLGTVGNVVAFVGLIIYLILGGILVAELVYILVLKAIQTALLTAQYMFAPIFLVFFATPDTESICAGYVRSFVEVSLWTFVWVGLLKILVIIVLSDFNPWGKIVMAVGVLQIMIQVPSFLARAQISPMSDFISAGLITGGLLSAGKALTNVLGNRAMHFAKSIGDHPFTGARGMPQSQKVELNSLPNGAANPEHLNNIRKRADEGKNFEFGKGINNDPNAKKKPGEGGPDTPPVGPDGKPLVPPGGPNAQKKPGEEGKPGEQNKTDKNGNPIDPTTGKPLVTPNAGQQGAQGTPEGNKLASDLADAAGKTGKTAATALGATALAGAALATAQSGGGVPGTGATNPGGGPVNEQDKKALEQQALEAQKKANDLKTAGAGDATGAPTPPGGKKDATLEAGKGTGQGDPKGKELNQGDGTNKDAKLTPGEVKTAATQAGLNTGAGGGKGTGTQGEQGKDLNVSTPVDTTKTGGDKDAKNKQGATDGQGGNINARDLASLASGGAGAVAGGVANGQGGKSTTPPINLEVEEEGTGAKTNANMGRELVAGQGDKGKGANLQQGQGVNGQGGGNQTLKTAGAGGDGTVNPDAAKVEVARKPGETGVKGSTGSHLGPDANLGDAAKTIATGRNPDLTTATVLEDSSVTGDPGAVVPPNAGKTIATGGAQGGAQGGGATGTNKEVVASQPGGKLDQQTNVQPGGSPVVTPTGAAKTGSGAGQTIDQQVLANNQPGGATLNTTGAPVVADTSGVGQQDMNLQADGVTIRPVVGIGGGNQTASGQPKLDGTVQSAQGGSQGGTVAGSNLQGVNTAGLNVQPPTNNAATGGTQLELPFDGVSVRPTVGANLGGKTPTTVNAVDGGQQDFTPPNASETVNATVNRTPGALSGHTPTAAVNPTINATGGSPITPGGGNNVNTLNAVNAQMAGGGSAGGGNNGGAGVIDNSGLNNGPPLGGRGGGGGGGGGGGRGIDVPFDDDGNGNSFDGGNSANSDINIPTKGGASGSTGKPWDNFQQAYYRWVPGRGLTIDIRTAQGPTQGPSPDGSATVVGDGKGHVNHVRYGQGGTDEQKSLHMISAGYAQNINSDNEAFDAARQSAIDAGEDQPKGAAQRIAAGILAYNGSNWNQTAAAKQNFQRSMFKHAVLGSEAYVNGQPGNAYTEYLTNRYGPMTDDQQAWGIHIMSDGTSPESGWNPAVVPATETLLNNSIPITAANRAMAANYNVLKSPAWQRGSAIRGGVKYMQAIAKQALPADAHPMEVDAFMGGAAPRMGPDLVNACAAITMAYGEDYCSDVDLVNNVAVAAQGGQPKDYQNAFAGIQRIMTVSKNISSTGGGGGGRTVQTSQTVPVGGGSGSGGGATTSVSSTILSGGGNAPPPVNGRPNTQEVDVIFTDDGGNGAPDHIQMPAIQATSNPNQGGGGAPDIRTRVIDARQGGGGGGSTPLHASVEVNHSSGGRGGDYSNEVMGAAQQVASSMKMDVSRARQIYMDMRAVGFSDDQIGNNKILSTALQVSEKDSSMMHTAAIAANVVPPKDYSMETVETVQTMLDCDSRWNGGNIDRPSIFTAQQIIQAHVPMARQELGGGASDAEVRQRACMMAYPTKDYVDQVRMDPRFYPRPVKTGSDQSGNATYGNTQVPVDVLADRLKRRAAGEVDGFLKQSGLT